MRGVRVGAQTSRRQSRADGRGGMRCGTGSEHACAIFSPTQTHLSGGTRVGRAVATQVLGRHQALLGPHGVHGLAVQASVAFLVGLIGLGLGPPVIALVLRLAGPKLRPAPEALRVFEVVGRGRSWEWVLGIAARNNEGSPCIHGQRHDSLRCR